MDKGAVNIVTMVATVVMAFTGLIELLLKFRTELAMISGKAKKSNDSITTYTQKYPNIIKCLTLYNLLGSGFIVVVLLTLYLFKVEDFGLSKLGIGANFFAYVLMGNGADKQPLNKNEADNKD